MYYENFNEFFILHVCLILIVVLNASSLLLFYFAFKKKEKATIFSKLSFYFSIINGCLAFIIYSNQTLYRYKFSKTFNLTIILLIASPIVTFYYSLYTKRRKIDLEKLPFSNINLEELGLKSYILFILQILSMIAILKSFSELRFRFF